MQGKNYSLKLISHEVKHIRFDVISNKMPIGEIPFSFTSIMKKKNDDEISIDLVADIHSDGYPIALSLDLNGVFYLKNWESLNMNKDIELKLVQILFPYLRAIITNVTALTDTTTITLPIINVLSLLQEQSN